jgi:DNA-binding NtrC family response regulator
MTALQQRIRESAEMDGSVLVLGESGSGKSLAARAIHACRRQHNGYFARLDCRVLSSDSLARELTRVTQDVDFRVDASMETAVTSGGCGTLVLEHIDSMGMPLQRKLQAMRTVGSAARCLQDQSHLRLIATTDVDLRDHVRQGQFHPDLHRLLCGQAVETPPLRERPEDIVQLGEHFLKQLASQEGRPTRSLSLDALELLESYHWPANVRELWNVLDRVCHVETGRDLTASMVRPWLGGETARLCDSALTLKEMERKLVEVTFARYHGNRERTARALGIGIRTLSGKLREYGYPPRGGPGSNATTFRTKTAENHSAASERGAHISS